VSPVKPAKAKAPAPEKSQAELELEVHAALDVDGVETHKRSNCSFAGSSCETEAFWLGVYLTQPGCNTSSLGQQNEVRLLQCIHI
jgi:hypothetical protein